MTKTTKQPWPLWFLFIAGAAVILLQATCADFAIAQGVPRGTVTTQMMESYPIRGFSSVDCSAEACNATGDLGQQCTDPAGLWLCDGAGAFVEFTGGTALAGSTFDVQLKGATGAHDSSTLAGALQWDDVLGELDVAGLDVANTSDFGGDITLSTAGATVDGKDISGQGAFKNEANAFTEDQSVASGKKVGLEGSGGDTYVLRDLDRDAVEVTVDGTIATRTEADNWRPPPCPANLNDVPFGGICTEAATGKIRFRGTLEAIP